MNKLVSIIVPVFNGEQYLKDCLNSIEKQSYKELEVILVDDGSMDSSSKICQSFVKKDKRFKMFNQKRGGHHELGNSELINQKENLLVLLIVMILLNRILLKDLFI